MKIVPFPSGGKDAAPDAAVIAELEAALAGADGPGAAGWRELRDDVRLLAPPIDPDFERALHERLVAPPTEEERLSPEGRLRPLPASCGAGGTGRHAAPACSRPVEPAHSRLS